SGSLSCVALVSSALLVFTDAMKELPVTLLYAEAARGTFEEGAISALMIVLAGTFPVILFVPAERLKSED
ncbi:hypothetical protein, partial [Escherichia coli]